MSCYIMHFEGQPIMWQAQSPSKSSHTILRQALLFPEKEKDNIIFSLEDKQPVRGGDPLLGAQSEQSESSDRNKRRLSVGSVFDIPATTAQSTRFKAVIPTDKVLFESAADLMQDDIHPEIESSTQIPTDTSEYTCHLLSQLSSSPLLPTMTSSQVSSVLSALEPNAVSQLSTLIPSAANCSPKCGDNINNSTADNHIHTDFFKLASNANITIVHELQSADNVQLEKAKKKRTFCLTGKDIIRYTENKFKDNVWYECSCCSFISARRATIVQHCVISHENNSNGNKISHVNNLQMNKCLACDNLFFSMHSLKIHYLYDHNSSNEEIEDILKLTVEMSKYVGSSGFTPIKADICALSEKDIQMAGPATIQHLHPDQHPQQVLNHNPAQFFPLFFNSEGQTNSQCQSEVFSPVSTITELSTTDLPQTVSSLSSSTASATVHQLSQSNNKGQQSATSPKLKDPALKKFRDLKLEKGGGKKCGLGGCALRFGTVSNLEYHRKCHYRTKWRCPECHISCTSWNTVSSHLWREHAVDIELYSCDHCTYKTNSLTRLLNLHRRIHSEERPFLCDVCGKGFKTTKQLRNHKSWHKLKEKSKSEIAEKLVNCVTCGRGFTCARLMRLHVQVVHKRLKPYLCYVCGHSAANKSSLRSHLSMHTGLRPYSCDECEYTTRDHNNLRRHKMRHSGIKRYKCPLCPYSSIQASTYKTHILKKHPGEQDGLLYRCEFCPFNTVKKENLLTHSARHQVLKTQDENTNE